MFLMFLGNGYRETVKEPDKMLVGGGGDLLLD